MPNPFNITAATDTIPLDAQGRGSITYTVSNVSGRARRGRARLVPSESAQAPWLSVDGEAERSFTADGTHQYTVRVAVPPGTPPGRSTFGLDVVSVENPDEEWSQGPRVGFAIGPSAPVKKPFPWWIVVVVVGVLLVGGLVAWLFGRGDSSVDPADDEPPGTTEPVETAKGNVLDRCRKTEDCGPNLSCAVAVAGGEGICVGQVGFSPCESNRACADGLLCHEGSCRGPLGFAACSNDAHCGPGLACLSGTCTGKAGFQGCNADKDCAGGLECQAGVCLGRLHYASCAEGQCGAGLSCVSGQCIGAPGFRGCASKDDCVAGLECVNGACLGPLRFAGCTTPAECQPGLICAKGSCLLPPGATCTLGANADCSTGQCLLFGLQGSPRCL